VLESLLIRNINLPTSVKKTIESKINAEQDAQNGFVLQKRSKKQNVVEGIADYQRIISTGLTKLRYETIKAQKNWLRQITPNHFMNGKNDSSILSDNSFFQSLFGYLSSRWVDIPVIQKKH
jgi:regulator of protease activity HflC (stomatin/prohibitin superfamily)